MGKLHPYLNDFFLIQHRINTSIFSPEDFSADDQLISRTAEHFVKQEVIPQLSLIEQHNYEAVIELFRKSGELGLLSIEIPEAYGGLSMDKKISGLVAEKMGFGGSFSVSFNIHAGVGTLPYIYFGTEQQKSKYLPLLGSGEWIGAYALTEPSAGSDALNAKSTAVLTEDGSWRLSGEKQWITNAKIADVFVVFARTNKGMTAFIVEKSYEGVSIGQEEKKRGIKGASTAAVIFEDVIIPADNVLGEVGKGHHVALNILNLARLKLASSNIGMAKQALQLAVQYGKERKQFNKPIINFPMIQEKIANMAITIFASESAAYRTAGQLDDALNQTENNEQISEILSKFAMECAVNKVYCSEMLDAVVDESVQIHGGNGYMKDYDIERLYRDARINRIFEGTNEINRLTIAKMIVKDFQLNHSLLTETNRDEISKANKQYILSAIQLLNKALNVLSDSQTNINQEQGKARLVADIVKDLYIMESSFLRTEQVLKRNGKESEAEIIQLMTDVICEEGYRKIEAAAISIIAATENNEEKKKCLLAEIQKMPIPVYRNLLIKKQKIAESVIDRLR